MIFLDMHIGLKSEATLFVHVRARAHMQARENTCTGARSAS